MPPFETGNVRGRVLLIEDTSVLREIQTLLLLRSGYEAVGCAEPGQALAQVDFRPFDLVVLNTDRPDLRTSEFIAALRGERRELRILAFVNDVNAGLARELRQNGVHRVSGRPLHPAAFLQEIDEALGLTLQPAAPKQHDTAGDQVDHMRAASADPYATPHLPFPLVSIRSVTSDDAGTGLRALSLDPSTGGAA